MPDLPPSFSTLLRDFASANSLLAEPLLPNPQIVVDGLPVGLLYEGINDFGDILFYCALGEIPSERTDEAYRLMLEGNHLWSATGGATLPGSVASRQAPARLPRKTSGRQSRNRTRTRSMSAPVSVPNVQVLRNTPQSRGSTRQGRAKKELVLTLASTPLTHRPKVLPINPRLVQASEACLDPLTFCFLLIFSNHALPHTTPRQF